MTIFRKKMKGFFTIELTMIIVVVMMVIFWCDIFIINEILKSTKISSFQTVVTNGVDFPYLLDGNRYEDEYVDCFTMNYCYTSNQEIIYSSYSNTFPSVDMNAEYVDSVRISMTSMSNRFRRLNRFEDRKEFLYENVYEIEKED